MFRFAVVDRSGLYIAVLQAFGEANERLVTASTVEDVLQRLRAMGWLTPVTLEELAAALHQLREWNLLDVTQNHSENYRTAIEYERKNLQYSLTKQGEAALAGIVHAVGVLTSTGALQTAVLDAIADRLADLVGEFDGGTDRRLFTVLSELESHLDALRSNTKQFNGELQRLLRAESVDLGLFREVKAATVAYLQEFLTDIEHRAHIIAAHVQAVEDRGVALLQHRALIGAELPQLSKEDPAVAWLEHRRARWAGLRAWFLPEDASQPRIEQLNVVGRKAIIALLQVLERITESRRRSSSAVEDFRELARWFSVLPETEDLHRLWSTAFGLSPARHTHVAHPDPELVSPNVSWSDAPPVEVSPLLRSAGRTERFTRTGQVRDVAALKARRAERAVAERSELRVAWDMLATGGPLRLSSFRQLEHSVFERLLDLLGRTLASKPDTDGMRRGMSSDGRIEMVLRPTGDDAQVRIRTPRGVFSGPDMIVDIAVPGRSALGRVERGSR